MNPEDRDLLEALLEEFRLLRKAVERVEIRLAEPSTKVPKKPRKPGLSEAEFRRLYEHIVEEFTSERTTRKLDEIIAGPTSDLSLFCSSNNLPIDFHKSKANIRDQILARIREDEQLSATYPMARREAAYLAEGKK